MSTGKADDDGSTRAKRFHRTCRGIGDGMRAREIRRNTESPLVVIRDIESIWRLVRERPGCKGWQRGPQYQGSWVTLVEGRGLS